MLNKLIYCLLLINLFYAQHHNENKKTIDKNKKVITDSRNIVNRAVNGVNSHLKKVENLHNRIKNSENLKYDQYNKLIKEYGVLISAYNKHRNAYCAELPPLWTLKNRESNIDDALNNCDNWYYEGRETGKKVGHTYYYLGLYKDFNSKVEGFLKSFLKNLYEIKKDNISINKLRDCFSRGYRLQVKNTINGLRTNNPKLLEFKNPHKSIAEKASQLKRVINNIKRRAK